MRTALIFVLLASALPSATLFAQAPASLASVFDGQITTIEREVLPLAQKMPADRYNFAPATGTPPAGTFDGVRTFGQQVRHIATVIYMASSSILNGEKTPVSIDGPNENGPANMTSKDESIAYLQGAIAFAHKAMRSITAQNALQPVPPPFAQPTRADAAAFIGLHTYDHYGQMVVYARLNGVTPGGGPPPAAPKGKAKGK
ncbi:MAG: DinB family protein [Acidobacteriota bacterium]